MDDGPHSADDKGWMSIGSLSQATGIPIGTLRSWEQRYGFPQPMRLESGHRRYALGDVARLRAIKEALERGNRPSAVVNAPASVLAQLIEVTPPRREAAPAGSHLGRMMAAALSLDEASLDLALERAMDDLGVRRFVHEALVPFLRDVGIAWVEGRLGVMHEHFASDRIKAIIDQRRRSHAGAAVVVCATLPGEHHDLGIHVGALLLSLAGLRIVFLGADTPVDEIGGATMQSGAVAVLIGSSSAADPADVTPQLASLRRLLPAAVEIAVGGANAAPPGVTLLLDFTGLEAWAETRAADLPTTTNENLSR